MVGLSVRAMRMQSSRFKVTESVGLDVSATADVTANATDIEAAKNRFFIDYL
jgi:hypothetical protein